MQLQAKVYELVGLGDTVDGETPEAETPEAETPEAETPEAATEQEVSAGGEEQGSGEE
jgi:hypothetical protein